MLLWRARILQRPFAALMFALFLALMVAASAQAYTVWGPKWPNANATYVIDSSYSNQGPGWDDRATYAVADWNGVTSSPFVFGQMSTSDNHIRALNIANECNDCLAWTRRWNSFWDPNEFIQFIVEVNIGSGYAFYDGTQAPSIPSNYYDLETVMRHELGHALGLCHSGGSGLLMSPTLPQGVVRPIDNDAANGDAYIYNPDYAGPDPEGGCIP